MSDNDIIIGLVALVLVVFSLVVSLLIPRRDPGFPGRNLRTFVVVAVLLVIAMLAAVELAGGEHESEEGGGETQAAETGAGDTGQMETGGGGGGEAQGDPAAGKEVFTSSGCGDCHTLSDAGTSGQVGPDLDEVLQGQDAAFIHESIVDPNAQIAEGFAEGVMPQDYGDQLSEQQLNDLVAYLQQATGGSR